MTSPTGKSPPETPAELNEEMRWLLKRAHDNGIDVRGGWECRNGDDHPDWDVLISRVTKRDKSE